MLDDLHQVKWSWDLTWEELLFFLFIFTRFNVKLEFVFSVES